MITPITPITPTQRDGLRFETIAAAGDAGRTLAPGLALPAALRVAVALADAARAEGDDVAELCRIVEDGEAYAAFARHEAAVAALLGLTDDLPGSHPFALMGEAARDLMGWWWEAGVRFGAAHEHLRRADVG